MGIVGRAGKNLHQQSSGQFLFMFRFLLLRRQVLTNVVFLDGTMNPGFFPVTPATTQSHWSKGREQQLKV